jgi:hypothetical protein
MGTHTLNVLIRRVSARFGGHFADQTPENSGQLKPRALLRAHALLPSALLAHILRSHPQTPCSIMKGPLAMCFPSKKSKDNFADPAADAADPAAASTAAPASTAPAPATTEPAPASEAAPKHEEHATSTDTTAPEPVKVEPAPAPQITTTIPDSTLDSQTATPIGPKVAIVIYSMYGHIAKSASHDPQVDMRDIDVACCSGRGCQVGH